MSSMKQIVEVGTSNWPEIIMSLTEEEKRVVVVVRGYEEEKDKEAVEEMEKRCEMMMGQQPGKASSMVIDLLGDPLCRIRHFPLHIMLIAEYGKEKEMVGVVRGCVKFLTNGRRGSMFVKVLYILGLRVSPAHRRLGIAMKLVQQLEAWGKQNGAEYASMATDTNNGPSINLFTTKCAYSKFRTPTMLVHPVHAHYKPIGSSIAIVRLPLRTAESIYRRVFANSEFFPKDVDLILSNELNLGTFIALSKNFLPYFNPHAGLLPPRFAILSVWNTKKVFKLQVVRKVSWLAYACCLGLRVLDAWMPWLKLPSIPNVFKKFGVYFMYGLHMEGKGASRYMKSLCSFVHNMARDDDGCAAIVAEVGPRDPVRVAIPHWKRFSWAEDLWCMKKLADDVNTDHGTCRDDDDGNADDQISNWAQTQSNSSVIFVDPRDF